MAIPFMGKIVQLIEYDRTLLALDDNGQVWVLAHPHNAALERVKITAHPLTIVVGKCLSS